MVEKRKKTTQIGIFHYPTTFRAGRKGRQMETGETRRSQKFIKASGCRRSSSLESKNEKDPQLLIIPTAEHQLPTSRGCRGRGRSRQCRDAPRSEVLRIGKQKERESAQARRNDGTSVGDTNGKVNRSKQSEAHGLGGVWEDGG